MIYQLGDLRVDVRGDCYVADNATVIGRVVLERDCSVWFNVVIRGDNDRIVIGEGANVQDAAVLHTDEGIPLVLGRGASIGHKAMLHGCTVGDGALIGINAVVLNGARIGRNCIVGANALVTEGKEIPDGSLAVGSPARVIRQLDDRQLAMLREISAHYIERGRLYRTALRPQA